MSKLRIDRLRKLADHLLNGKLGHETFDFSEFNEVELGDGFDENGCGAMGCAIGERPIAFPDEWKFNRAHDPILKALEGKVECVSVGKSAMVFFGISEREYGELFMPGAYAGVTEIYLEGDATKEEVASRILKFCDIKEKENEQENE